jgi:hypothetical protein
MRQLSGAFLKSWQAVTLCLSFHTSTVRYKQCCGSGAFLTPGFVIRNGKSRSGSGTNIPDHISKSLERIFWVKILKLFDADPDPGSGIREYVWPSIQDLGSRTEKIGSGIWGTGSRMFFLSCNTGYKAWSAFYFLYLNSCSSVFQRTLQRQNAENLKQIFPEKEYRGLSPIFPHSCVCERIIYSHDGSAFSARVNMWTDPGNI